MWILKNIVLQVRRSFWLFLIVALFGVEACHGALMVDGKFTYEAGSKKTGGQFKVIVSDCSWIIRTKRDDETAVDYFEAGGKWGESSIYFLSSFTNSYSKLLESKATGSDETDGVVGVGRIYAGEVPHINESESLSILWLAYASRCYLDKNENKLLEPVNWFGGQQFFDKGLFLPATVLRFENLKGLPEKVVYYNDGFFRGINGGTGEAVIRKLDPPFDGGYTNAIYSVIEKVNSGAVVVPKTFTFTTFRPAPGGAGSNNVTSVKRYAFYADNLYDTNVEIVAYYPILHGKTSISDRRGVSSNSTVLEYQANQSFVEAAKASKKNSTRIPSQIIADDSSGKTAAKPRFVFIGTLFLVTGLFLILILKRKDTKI